jgi:CO/xanthine dehydrogenase FAD-binding subunit
VLASDAATVLVGREIDDQAAREAAREAVRECSPPDEYRRRVIATTVERALRLAAGRARP